MRSRPKALILISAMLALAGIATACGGSNKALEEYFLESDRIGMDYRAPVEAVTEIYQQILASSPTEEQQVNAFKALLKVSAENLRQEIAAKGELDPPEEVRDAHAELLTASVMVASVYEDVLDRTEEVTTSAELQEVLEEIDYQARLDEGEKAAVEPCQALQLLANENDFDVDVC